MFDIPSNPTELQYKYYFLSVSQPEGEDGLPCALLLQQFKPDLEKLVQDFSSGRLTRPGNKRKVGIDTGSWLRNKAFCYFHRSYNLTVGVKE